MGWIGEAPLTISVDIGMWAVACELCAAADLTWRGGGETPLKLSPLQRGGELVALREFTVIRRNRFNMLWQTVSTQK